MSEKRSAVGAITVEIVDDHFLFADSLARVLGQLPEYELVGIAVTGPQALALAREKQPDVILLDYHLPGETADQLAPRLKAASAASRIIILTSDTSAASLAKGIQAGVAGYLTKDRAVDEVVEAVRHVAAGGDYLTKDQLASAAQRENDRDALTAREVEILTMLAGGTDVTGIGTALSISTHTVRAHVQNIFTKLGAHSRLEAVVIARTRGLIAR